MGLELYGDLPAGYEKDFKCERNQVAGDCNYDCGYRYPAESGPEVVAHAGFASRRVFFLVLTGR